jgi:putative lumazine-binding protein
MRLSKLTLVIAALSLAPLSNSSGQSQADSVAIRQTALDYIQGWYTGDAARMERALHPELAKRIVRTDTLGNYRLDQQSAMTLVQGTRNGYGKTTPQADRLDDVRILDIYRNAASVRVNASYWVDYLQLAKWHGRWVIVNVLWELKPKA